MIDSEQLSQVDSAEADNGDDIRPIFDRGHRRCTIVLNQVIYPDLRVKQIRDIPKGCAVYLVLIPCAKERGTNLMVCFDWRIAVGLPADDEEEFDE